MSAPKIPRRDAVLGLFASLGRALEASEIAAELGVAPHSRDALERVLDDLVWDGSLVSTRGNRFDVPGRPSAEAPAGATPPRVRRGRASGASSDAPKRAIGRATSQSLTGASRGGSAPPKRLPPRAVEAKVDEPRAVESMGERVVPAERNPASTSWQGAGSRGGLEGTLSVNPRGFGFVSIGGGKDDVFVPAESLGGALHGDRVVVSIVRRSSRGTEGAIVSIAARRPARVAGILRRRGRSAWLEPDDARLRGPIVLRAADVGGSDAGREGDAVIADITQFPDGIDENPEGVLVEVLGRPGEPDVEVKKILAVRGVVEPHGLEAVAEAEAFGPEVAHDALSGREDLTHLPLPTIDPEDARDHDDALWAERRPEGGYRLWVAIADVSHYVRPGTAIDEEARGRGCSLYLPDRSVPMLPRALSSNLCSLLPGVVRLCLCVEAELDAEAKIERTRVFEGFMRSRAKLTYGGVARALGLTDVPPVSAEAESMVDDLRVLRELGALLRAARMRRGALDFELPEAKVVVDPDTRMPTAALRRATDPGIAKAYQIVEEMMLLANEAVAVWLTERSVPTIFRNHAAPNPEKIARFAALCTRLGVAFDEEEAQDPKALSSFLRKLRNHPNRSILDTLMVRSLKQAVYDVNNIGHFGLASTAYVHFTSPIRRYPDLVVHRGVRAVLRRERIDRSTDGVDAMQAAAQIASERERRAMEIEREVVDLYRALFMRDAVGETFRGTVTGIVASGAFVTLDDPFVEVLVRTESLGRDDYAPDDDGLSIVGRRSGDRVSVGDAMMVVVEDVSLERRTVYARRIELGESEERPSSTRSRRTIARRATASITEDRGRPARPSGKRSHADDDRSAPSKKGRATAKPGSSSTKSKASAKPSRSERKANGKASKKGAAKVRSKGKAKARKKR